VTAIVVEVVRGGVLSPRGVLAGVIRFSPFPRELFPLSVFEGTK
jgi:hypothetical protein